MATMSVAPVCTQDGTLRKANNITPRKVASKKKCGYHFVCQQRAGNVANTIHEPRPVGSKLKRHRHATHHTQTEAQGKDLGKIEIKLHPLVVSGTIVSQLEKQQQPTQCNGNGRK